MSNKALMIDFVCEIQVLIENKKDKEVIQNRSLLIKVSSHK